MSNNFSLSKLSRLFRAGNVGLALSVDASGNPITVFPNSSVFTTGGTLTAYTLTPSPAITAYAAGQSFFVTFNAASGEAPTLTISVVATPPQLVKQLGDGTYANIAAGDIPINHRSQVTLLSTTQALVARLPVVPLATNQSGGTVNATTGVFSGALSVKTIRETRTAPAITANVLTLDLLLGGIFDVALNAAITTLTLSNPPTTGIALGFTLIFTADGTAQAITWPVAVKWVGGIAPTVTVTNGKKDFFTFFTADAGASYQAFVAGQNI